MPEDKKDNIIDFNQKNKSKKRNTANEKDKWISVKDHMPKESESYFSDIYKDIELPDGKWKKESDEVLITVVLSNGSKRVVPALTHDGKWCIGSLLDVLDPNLRVTHWIPYPEPADD